MMHLRKLNRYAVRAPTCRLVTARCGIIGIVGRGDAVAAELYEGLLMLQHRGQDSAGMVTTDWTKFIEHKANGLVRDVFGSDQMKQLVGASSCKSSILRKCSSTTARV